MKAILGTILNGYHSLLHLLSNSKGVNILMYHRINDDFPPSDLIISIKKFWEQMKYFKKYCDVVGIEELCHMFENKGMRCRRRPQVVITIDDGYRDNYLNAYPILREFNLPATIFLATGFIGTDKRMLRYEHMPVPDMLSWEEVKIMKENNITFGPHTTSHPHLCELNYTEQRVEIESSMHTLYQQLSQEIAKSVFCYPYGEYNEDTLKIMKELRIKIALTTNYGINCPHENPIELKRISADGRDGRTDFMRKLAPDIVMDSSGENRS